MRAGIATIVLSLLFLTTGAVEAKSTTHTVAMQGNQFVPATLTVKPGDSVIWVNKDLAAHTATSSAAGFDSKAIEAGKSWKHTIRKKGDFQYGCTYHPFMKGVLRVQ